MSSRHSRTARWARAIQRLVLLLLVIAVSGCGDPDGSGSSPVRPKPGPSFSRVGDTQVDILAVQLDELLSVEFSVRDAQDGLISGLDGEQLHFTLARLLPGTDGRGDSWQSYILVADAPNGLDVGLAPRRNATVDSGGSLEEIGDGIYRYVFGVALDGSAVSGLQLDPELTHRLGIEAIPAGLPAGNATWTGALTGDAATRALDIIGVEGCNSCHHALSAHEGTRMDPRYCVTCHTPQTADADGGRSLDFGVLIHQLHRGEALPSVAAGKGLRYWDEDDQPQDYSNVKFPQDIRHCESCHQDSSAELPMADNWRSRPSAAACGSCHEAVDFTTGQGHADQLIAGDDECQLCHQPGGAAGGVLQNHAIAEELAADAFGLEILAVDNTAPGARPQIRFRVSNPLQGGVSYDLEQDPAWTSTFSRLSIILAWDTRDFHNTGSGALPAQPIQMNALGRLINNGDGSYRVESPQALPSDAQGSGVVALTARAAADLDADGHYTDALAIASTSQVFAITDTSPQARRNVVSQQRCESCHQRLSAHAGERNGDPQLCVLCHNANATDVQGRPADAADTPDGQTEQNLDFKTLIHAIHDAEHNRLPSSVTDYILPPQGPLEPRPHLYIYDTQGQVHEFGELRYPGVMGNCAACHEGESYMLPMPTEVLSTTVDTGWNLADPMDDFNMTRSKAVCTSCHYWQGEHMDTEGLSSSNAIYPLVDAGLDTEQCIHCHGAGAMADVGAMHHIID